MTITRWRSMIGTSRSWENSPKRSISGKSYMRISRNSSFLPRWKRSWPNMVYQRKISVTLPWTRACFSRNPDSGKYSKNVIPPKTRDVLGKSGSCTKTFPWDDTTKWSHSIHEGARHLPATQSPNIMKMPKRMQVSWLIKKGCTSTYQAAVMTKEIILSRQKSNWKNRQSKNINESMYTKNKNYTSNFLNTSTLSNFSHVNPSLPKCP